MFCLSCLCWTVLCVTVFGEQMTVQTEDYALGMELKKEGYHCRYVREYLALGALALSLCLQRTSG